MKKNQARRALFMSVLAMLLCVSMFVGTTFAWFTDSVTSANNIIKSGTLDVEMYWADGTKAVPADGSTDWKDASAGAIFNYSLWEPGYTAVRHIKIANVGNLALKYQVQIVANGEVSDLADVIDVYYTDPAVQVADRTALTDSNKIGTLTEVLAGIGGTARGSLEANTSVTVTIALKMQESAGNEYQDKAIGSDFSIVLLATQETYEKDSFDEFYDKNAWVDGLDIYTEEDLNTALANGETVIDVMDDIDLTGPIVIPASATTYSLRTNAITINLNGKTISAALHKNDGPVIKNEGNLVLKNGTVSSTANNGGSAIVNNGTAVLENVTLNGAPNADGSWPSYTVNNTGTLTATNAKFTSYHGSVASYGDGAQVTLNNCEIDMAGIPGFTNHGIYTYDNGKVVVNGGTYANKATDQNSTGASVINGAVEVNGGTFTGRIEKYYGTPVIKGGTFSVNPANFIAAGYEVTDNGDGTWTVGARKVSTEAELADAIANGKVVELTQDINLGKIDLTGAITNDVVINANGHKITTADSYGIEVTAGKNVTISNADVVMTKAGDFNTYAAGFKIANGDYAGATITLENCKITMANTDWAYAVNMPASVKNLNLVIDKCTLEGAIAVQCWGDNNTITITNSKLICNYTTNAMYTSYCVALQGDSYNKAENNKLVIENCEFAYSGIDNYNSVIKAAADIAEANTVTVTNCTYGEKVVAN